MNEKTVFILGFMILVILMSMSFSKGLWAVDIAYNGCVLNKQVDIGFGIKQSMTMNELHTYGLSVLVLSFILSTTSSLLIGYMLSCVIHNNLNRKVKKQL